jgi:hypothetical protein
LLWRGSTRHAGGGARPDGELSAADKSPTLSQSHIHSGSDGPPGIRLPGVVLTAATSAESCRVQLVAQLKAVGRSPQRNLHLEIGPQGHRDRVMHRRRPRVAVRQAVVDRAVTEPALGAPPGAVPQELGAQHPVGTAKLVVGGTPRTPRRIRRSIDGAGRRAWRLPTRTCRRRCRSRSHHPVYGADLCKRHAPNVFRALVRPE